MHHFEILFLHVNDDSDSVAHWHAYVIGRNKIDFSGLDRFDEKILFQLRPITSIATEEALVHWDSVIIENFNNLLDKQLRQEKQWKSSASYYFF